MEKKPPKAPKAPKAKPDATASVESAATAKVAAKPSKVKDIAEAKAKRESEAGKLKQLAKAKSQNFIFELQSYHPGRVHAVIASSKEQAIEIVIADLMENKYAAALAAHKGDDTVFGSLERFKVEQRKIYLSRQIAKRIPTKEKARLVGRNVSPLPNPPQHQAQ
jgi:hypothetical protein